MSLVIHLLSWTKIYVAAVHRHLGLDLLFCYMWLTIIWTSIKRTRENHSINATTQIAKWANLPLGPTRPALPYLVRNGSIKRFCKKMRSSKKGVAFAKKNIKSGKKKNASTGQCSRFKSTPACPVRIAEKIIRASGMTPRKVPKIKKALIVHNVMLKGLQDSKIGRKYILQASNQHLKSQRCHRVLTRALKVGRNWYREKAKTLPAPTVSLSYSKYRNWGWQKLGRIWQQGAWLSCTKWKHYL